MFSVVAPRHIIVRSCTALRFKYSTGCVNLHRPSSFQRSSMTNLDIAVPFLQYTPTSLNNNLSIHFDTYTVPGRRQHGDLTFGAFNSHIDHVFQSHINRLDGEDMSTHRKVLYLVCFSSRLFETRPVYGACLPTTLYASVSHAATKRQCTGHIDSWTTT